MQAAMCVVQDVLQIIGFGPMEDVLSSYARRSGRARRCGIDQLWLQVLCDATDSLPCAEARSSI